MSLTRLSFSGQNAMVPYSTYQAVSRFEFPYLLAMVDSLYSSEGLRQTQSPSPNVAESGETLPSRYSAAKK